jgi:UDP-2,3-diacylglucosamine pyrophosphatase LpxH
MRILFLSAKAGEREAAMHGIIADVAEIRERRGRRHRTLFLSDLHLGARAVQIAAVLEFLNTHEADTIYLVGDIIDIWRLQSGARWLISHGEVLNRLLSKLNEGSRVIYVPGNHDEALRSCAGMQFGGVEIMREAVHLTADGRRLLVTHGDEFDAAARHAAWKRFAGDRSYEFVLWCDRPINWARRQFGLRFWSLSNYAKARVKAAIAFIEDFEAMVAGEAGRRGFDGVICGHIHFPAAKNIGDVSYLNCGDWVESCTAIGEDDQGQLRLIRWPEHDSQSEPEIAGRLVLNAA